MVIFAEAPPDHGVGVLETNSGLQPILEMDAAGSWLRQRGLPVARCAIESLPLENECLGVVLVSQAAWVASGDWLEELCRVLKPGGTLLVSGVNRFGLGGLGRGARVAPAVKEPAARGLSNAANNSSRATLSALALRKQLENQDMRVTGLFGAGFLRGPSPRDMSVGLARLLAPLADVLLLEARKAEPPSSRLVLDSRMRAVGAPSALAGAE